MDALADVHSPDSHGLILRRTFRDFLDKASASGPNTVAFVYLSGYGLQLEGENLADFGLADNPSILASFELEPLAHAET